MAKDKYKKQIDSLFERSPVVNYSSIKKIIENKNNVKQYTKRFINYLLSKEKIKRLAKGYYTKFDDVSLTVFCFQPAYFGLQDSMSFHELWEQETIPIIITTRKVRQGIRKVLGVNVFIRRIEKKYFFGVEYYQEGKLAFPYSDIEKTFIDMVYFKEHMDKDVLKEFNKKIDSEKLKKYLKKYPKKTSSQVLKLIKGK